jgi:hypothetical protein
VKELAELASEYRANRIGDFASYCRLLALNKGSASNALNMASNQRASERVITLLREKASIGAAGAGTAGSWAEQTVSQRLIMGAFSDSLKARSAWAAMQPLIFKVPLETTLGIIATTVSNAAAIAPGMPVPVRRLDAIQQGVSRRKVASMVILTDEFMRQSASEAESVITRELTYAVSRQVDVEVLASLFALSPPLTLTATSSLANDVATLLTLVAPQPDSRLVFWASPDMATRLTASYVSGIRTFDNTTVSRGEIFGIPIFVSGGVASGTLVLLDAARLAGNLDAAEVSISTQAAVEMLDVGLQQSAGTGSPAAGTGAQMVSLFQTNSVGIKVTQYFGVAQLRPGGVVSLYAGGSP